MREDLIERLRREADISARPGQMDRLNALAGEFTAALEAAREDACVALVADIRFACGDNGKRMQPELVEFIRGLAEDAERYRWLRRKVSAHGIIDGWTFAFPTHLTLPAPASAMRDPAGALDAAIDQARGKGGA